MKLSILALLLILLTTGATLAQTPLDYVMSHRDKLDELSRLSLDSALLERLIQSGKTREALDFLEGVDAEESPEVILSGAVLLDAHGDHQTAFAQASSLLPTGSFEDRLSVKPAFLKGATTAAEAEARLALLRERGGLEPLELALTVATFEGEKEALEVYSRALAAQPPTLDSLPLVKVYLKVASFGLPETAVWAEQVTTRLDELGYDYWNEMYFALPRREAAVVELLEERLLTQVQDKQNLPAMLDLFFQAEQASLPLEARLIPLLDALVTDSPMDRLESFSQLPDYVLYLGYRGRDEFALDLIANLGEMIEREITLAESRGDDPERLATARQGREELMTQLKVGVAAGMWCAGEQEGGIALAAEACGDREAALTRMAGQTFGKLRCYDDLARLVPDDAIEVWTPAATSQISEGIEVTYWMERIRNLPPSLRQEAAGAIKNTSGLPRNVQSELESLSPEGLQISSSDGEDKLKALEALRPEIDGWTLVLFSILAVNDLDLSPSQRARLEAYCKSL